MLHVVGVGRRQHEGNQKVNRKDLYLLLVSPGAACGPPGTTATTFSGICPGRERVGIVLLWRPKDPSTQLLPDPPTTATYLILFLFPPRPVSSPHQPPVDLLALAGSGGRAAMLLPLAAACTQWPLTAHCAHHWQPFYDSRSHFHCCNRSLLSCPIMRRI